VVGSFSPGDFVLRVHCLLVVGSDESKRLCGLWPIKSLIEPHCQFGYDRVHVQINQNYDTHKYFPSLAENASLLSAYPVYRWTDDTYNSVDAGFRRTKVPTVI